MIDEICIYIFSRYLSSLFLIRWLLSFTYIWSKVHTADFPEQLLQWFNHIPFLETSRLESDLRANLQQTEAVEFYWLIDQSDTEAQRVADQICQEASFAQRIRIFLLLKNVPQGINPKSYKIEQVVEELTPSISDCFGR